MEMIDLRSDTVTRPTPAMRKAMYEAALGDDVFGEDPTINALQELAAKKMGKEAGLFVASGTMGNLIAVLAHCNRSDEVILGDLSHVFLYEGGGISSLGGLHPRTVPNQPDGTLKLEDIRAAIRPDDDHCPHTHLIVLENTQNRCGGVPLTADYTNQVGKLAREQGLLLHLDGARIFNAAAALDTPVGDLTAAADSVTFCLSKGLCAPVGSVLCGSAAFIRQSRRIRKQLGGGMRQAGVLAAAGIVSLTEMTGRLGEDHRRARLLAKGLAEIPGTRFKDAVPPSNMVFLGLDATVAFTDEDLLAQLQGQGVLVDWADKRVFRLVTHYWIDDVAIERTIAVFGEILG